MFFSGVGHFFPCVYKKSVLDFSVSHVFNCSTIAKVLRVMREGQSLPADTKPTNYNIVSGMTVACVRTIQ